MSGSFKQFPENPQDAPDYYREQGRFIYAVPKLGKATFAGSRGHLDAATDPAVIREMQKMHPGCVWAQDNGRSRRATIDIEQREIRGEDGPISLRQYAERMGFTESLIPYGLTPINVTPNVGLHVEFAADDIQTGSSILLLPYVELKAGGASTRLPPAPGRYWDPNSPPSLEPLPLPDWVRAILHLRAKSAKSRPPLPPEGPLNGQPFTPIGRRIAEGLIKRALDQAASSREACREARGLASLVVADRLSEAFARRAIERLAEEIGEFHESGFTRNGLRKAMMTSFERRCRRG
jgi:hypothetical protein